ncbi:hypothetical protein V8C43DRAFT_65974 [Trichoderma afarasin]
MMGLEFFTALVRNARLATFPRDRVPFCGHTKHQRRVLFLSLTHLSSLFSILFLPVLLDSELKRRFILLLFLPLLFFLFWVVACSHRIPASGFPRQSDPILVPRK